MAGEDFKVVRVSVAGTIKEVQMEKGVLFQNNGGTYCIFSDGSLKFQKKGANKKRKRDDKNRGNKKHRKTK